MGQRSGRTKREAAPIYAPELSPEDLPRSGRPDGKRLKADGKAGAQGDAQRGAVDAAGEELRVKPQGVPGKQCVECGATATPQWREGPHGES